MTAEWYNAFFGHDTPVVLRLKMKPHCIGHRLLLERHCPGFGSEALSFESLVLASLICSHGYNAGRELLRSRWLPLFCGLWGWSCRNLNPVDEATKFAEYERDALWIPPIEFPMNSKASAHSPIELRKLAIATSRFGMSMEDALEAPISQLTALEYSLLEDEGKAKFIPLEVQNMIDLAHQAQYS